MGAAGSSLELPVERDDMKPYVEKLTKIQAKLESEQEAKLSPQMICSPNPGPFSMLEFW